MFANFRNFAISFVLLSLTTAVVFADTIKLKDGSVIKGRITEIRSQQITVLRTSSNNRTSEITIEADEIESVEFDSITNLTRLIDNSRANSAQIQPARSDSTATVNPNSNRSTTTNNSGAANSTATQTTIPQISPNPTVNRSTQVSNSPQTANSQPARTAVNNGNGRYIPVSIKVLADNTANGWTNTGLVVKKGQRLRISASGRIALGKGNFATPAGLGSIADGERLMKTEPTGALIAVIGDDNNDFVFIGAVREFVATRDGTLFLGVNEGFLDDNSGAYDAVVEAEAIDSTAQR